MQSEAVFFDDKAFRHGKKGTDTEIARTLLPVQSFLQAYWKFDELQRDFNEGVFYKTLEENCKKNT